MDMLVVTESVANSIIVSSQFLSETFSGLNRHAIGFEIASS